MNDWIECGGMAYPFPTNEIDEGDWLGDDQEDEEEIEFDPSKIQEF